MCGIFGYVSSNRKQVTGNRKLKNAAKIVFEGLKTLEYRGYDSWGIAFKIQSSKFKVQNLLLEKHIGKISNSTLNSPARGEARQRRQLSTLNSRVALGHTRWATHGGVTVANAHPHLDCQGKIAVVHNGIIENWREIKNELLIKGHVFKSQTDSEVFSHLIEQYVKNTSLHLAVQKAFARIHGRNAFVILTSEGSMVGIRDGSPLVFGVGEREFFLASDVTAFLDRTRNVIFLDDKQGVVVDQNGFQVLDFISGKVISPKIEKISWSVSQAQKGKYPHFLIKEILEQPVTIAASSVQSKKEIEQLAQMIRNAFGSYLVACGTASYAALYGTYVFSQVAKKHINWSIGSEFPDYQYFLSPRSLVIAVSQSGETADTLEAVKIAKDRGAKTVAIVNVMGSTLMRMAGFSILTNVGPEIAVVSTKAFTAQLSVLLLLAYATAGRFEEGQGVIAKIAKALDAMLSENFLNKIRSLSKKLKNSQHIYVIGKGQNYPIALEAALKIKEASYIHGEGFAAGELKHGVITLIEKGIPCIVLFGNDDDRDYSLSSAMEMKARGGMIIGIGPENNEVFDEFIKVPGIIEASAIINTIPVQLLAYYLAVEKGLDPDKPRNLAKSVTVK